MKTDQAVAVSQTFNGRAEWQVAGGYFKLMVAASAVALELWNQGRKILDAPGTLAGFYQRVEFDKIVITNPSSQAVTYLAAGDEGGSDRFTGTFDLQRAAALTDATTVVGVAAAQVLAAVAGRKVIYFRARTGNTQDIILGSPAVTVNGAIRLAAGTQITIDTAAAAEWWGIAAGAGQNLDILTGA